MLMYKPCGCIYEIERLWWGGAVRALTLLHQPYRLDQLKIIEIILKRRKFQIQTILKFFVRPDVMGGGGALW